MDVSDDQLSSPRSSLTDEEEEEADTDSTPRLTSPRDAETKHGNLEKLVALIQREPQSRTDFECQEFVPFLKKHIEWFKDIKAELVHAIIKQCKFLRYPPETVFIKQGDIGDSMYAILQGDVTVHVITDTENEHECFSKVEAAINKKKFNKVDFGNEVAYKGSGTCVGEVALLRDNCMRTASCITATVTDFIVIDRQLYSVSVKEFLEKQYQDKTQFVDRNPLFRLWTPKQRNQLVISLTKVRIGYNERLVKQGREVDGVYFVFKGDVTISIESHRYKRQFPALYTELKKLLPELITESRRATQAPHELRKERLAGHKPQEICILGENEIIGAVEMLLGLESHIETAIAPGECELLMLRRAQFERLFRRKYAAVTLEKLREAQAQKLCLYIYQSDPSRVEFLKFLNMRLMDSSVLQEVKKSKHAKARQAANIGAQKITKSVEEKDIISVLKRLHMNSDSAAELPPEDMSEIALAKMDRRLRVWSEKTNMNGSKLAGLQSSSIILNA
ncbi:CAMP-dependent protein kinase regulatory subunit [Plakobranchus ocellatus]|uniref:cAMP-dependent protein kinase regulatory subunit n=1 Tax=Plakobranchus ocellatus TaxID=259542 RepID=A0AAV4ACB0_9GAST|nr:CAMP-dependent protein kinase regulatory subunit [Plakobranchus ocellatus]